MCVSFDTQFVGGVLINPLFNQILDLLRGRLRHVLDIKYISHATYSINRHYYCCGTTRHRWVKTHDGVPVAFFPRVSCGTYSQWPSFSHSVSRTLHSERRKYRVLLYVLLLINQCPRARANFASSSKECWPVPFRIQTVLIGNDIFI